LVDRHLSHDQYIPDRGRVLPIMDYTGMLHPKGVPFSHAPGMGKGFLFQAGGI